MAEFVIRVDLQKLGMHLLYCAITHHRRIFSRSLDLPGKRNNPIPRDRSFKAVDLGILAMNKNLHETDTHFCHGENVARPKIKARSIILTQSDTDINGVR